MKSYATMRIKETEKKKLEQKSRNIINYKSIEQIMF